MFDGDVVAQPSVVVLTLNWNGLQDTIECLESIRRLTYPNYRVVVVDNGSTDGSADAFRQRFPEVTVIQNASNLGYAKGFNTGLDYAFAHGADYVLVLNNDTIVDPEAVTALVRVAEQDPGIGFVSGKVYSFAQPETLQTAGRESDPVMLVGRHVGGSEVDVGQCDVERDYDFVDDVFLLASCQVYQSVGGYNPNFFLYYEETDWCARVRRAGYRIAYTPNARIWHKGMVGNSGLQLSPSRVYFLQRNQIIFMRRNASPAQWSAFLRRTVLEWCLYVARCARHGEFRKLAARSRGLAEGLLWAVRGDPTA